MTKGADGLVNLLTTGAAGWLTFSPDKFSGASLPLANKLSIRLRLWSKPRCQRRVDNAKFLPAAYEFLIGMALVWNWC